MSAGWRRLLLAVGTCLIGPYLTLRLAAEAIYAVEDHEPGAADCDDCGITILLDNIGWLGLSLVAYLVAVGLVARALRVRSSTAASLRHGHRPG